MVTVDRFVSRAERCEQLLALMIRAQLSVAVADLVILADTVSVVAIRLRVFENDLLLEHRVEKFAEWQCDEYMIFQ